MESLPDVPFDVGELYSGSVPIEKGNSSRTLFFVFQPTVGEPVDEITIEVNGGPGASSLEGFLQETGRFVWPPGTYAPVINPYSWVNLTNMLWYVSIVSFGIPSLIFTIGLISPLGRGFLQAHLLLPLKRRRPGTFLISLRTFKTSLESRNSRFT